MLFVDTLFLTSVFHLLCYRVSLAVEKMRGHGITFSETEDAQLEIVDTRSSDRQNVTRKVEVWKTGLGRVLAR